MRNSRESGDATGASPDDDNTALGREVGGASDDAVDLRRLDLALLRRRWRAVMRRPAPSGLPRHLMIRILLWREQIARTGDLDATTLARLETSLDNPGATPATGPRHARAGLRPGTVLVREHAGGMHRVMVVERGFAWNGRTFSSLSGVARAITGTNWNGHRFFGLSRELGRRDAPEQPSPAQARSRRRASTCP